MPIQQALRQLESQGLAENPSSRPKIWPRSQVCPPSPALAAHLPHEPSGGICWGSYLQAVLAKSTLLYRHRPSAEAGGCAGRGPGQWGAGCRSVSKPLQPQRRVLCLPQREFRSLLNVLPRYFCSRTSWSSPAISARATPALLYCRIIVCSILLCFSDELSLSVG